MLIFKATPIISILLFVLSGISSSSARPTSSPPTTDRDPVQIQTFNHTEDSCAPSLQAMDNTNDDIACVLENFRPFTLSGINLVCSNGESNNGESSNESFPGLYRSLIETFSKFERSDLAAQNFSESVCTLKRFVIPELNKTVDNHCNCLNSSVHCATLNVSSASNNVSSEEENNEDEECLLFYLIDTLDRIQIELGGIQHRAECKRASNVQWQLLTDFQDAIEHFVLSLFPLDLEVPEEVPCIYKGQDLSSHVTSLYTIVPYLSNLNTSEPQHFSGNISEVIFPVISQLLGEDYVETQINSSRPFSSSEETTLETLSETERTACLSNRLSTIYDRFMTALKLQVEAPACKT